MHPEVALAMTLFEPLGGVEPAIAETDNGEYGAAVTRIGSQRLRFRVGKLTPTKVGLFVAVWRRSTTGATEPFPADDVDLLVIITTEGQNAGQFVFPRSALQRHGIGSVAGVGGKRGLRVYPPWSPTDNAQAIRTQKWQGEYFVDTRDGVDLDRLRALLET
ncbi:hypothetical protein E3O42_15045 [Cryobacterium adonitolivorans]|uniref:MepB domain containing protein n=1 Tax=Cryobacterium adonitolivorans TaxID=1259189 RepID=A0A4V3IC44_9MICO|nr:MepB family protein [Cryobacterium adonitolivorans]TFB98681.1 hypothetical protein E3O42_15045 [Cryobacterium adonitolivorans]